MKIVAHISKQEKNESLLLTILRAIEQNSKRAFLLFSDETINNLDSKDCVQLPAPKNNSKFAQFFWYKFKLPSLLKKEKDFVFISELGNIMHNATYPQFLFFASVDFKTNPNKYFKKVFIAALQNAKHIFVAENFIKEILINEFALLPEKITTTYYGVIKKNIFSSNDVSLKIKDTYSNGYDYFLFEVNQSSADKLLILLKAFSLFKKWQKSALKLGLLLQNISEENLIHNFTNYKYKDDIFFVKVDAEALVASAFACIHFTNYAANSLSFVALQNRVPVIAVENNTNNSIFENAALFCTLSEKSLSEKMQLLYKNEYIRNEITANGLALLQKYNATTASKILYDFISTS
jgi:glycosyltransferase involved in cell wall biosynthesis